MGLFIVMRGMGWDVLAWVTKGESEVGREGDGRER